jgi:hypothetical protein
MAIDHISRILNMLSKKEIGTIKQELNLNNFNDTTRDINNVIENVNRNLEYKKSILHRYKYVFKPHSSHIFTYSDLNIDSIGDFEFGDWSITNTETDEGMHYYLVEKDYMTNRINAGWNYISMEVK